MASFALNQPLTIPSGLPVGKSSRDVFQFKFASDSLKLNTMEGRKNDCRFLGYMSESNRKLTLVVRSQVSNGSSSVETQEVEFVWKGPGNEVLFTGNFLSWTDKIKMTKIDDNKFLCKQNLNPGSHSFKFIVDGIWLHSTDYPTVHDGAGGFNNVILVEEPPITPPVAAQRTESDPAKVEAKKVEDSPEAAAPAAPAKKAAPKVVKKSIEDAMSEDIIPQLNERLGKETGLVDLSLTFADNQLRGSFSKDSAAYNFWCYFPDGTLEGSRGFSLATHGASPSTVEPFIIDEKKITPEIVVFWVYKRLFAQKLFSLN